MTQPKILKAHRAPVANSDLAPGKSSSRRKITGILAGGIALLGLDACSTSSGRPAAPRPEAISVPHSAGTAPPDFAMPALACDGHHHIYDRRFPAHPSATLLPADASVADYHRLQQRLGLQRNVIVQPSTYGVDNRLLVDALTAFGANSRGVAVVNTQVKESELQALHQSGVRGIRFNLSFMVDITPDMMEPLSHRIAALGWHMQVNGTADRLLAVADTLKRLACPVVFDHMGQLPQPLGIKHPAFALYKALLESGKAWFKLSGPYLTGKAPDLSDVAGVAQAYASIAPNRLVWGSDWPHPTKKAAEKPDDALLLNLLHTWFSPAVRQQILVDNPARLYGF